MHPRSMHVHATNKETSQQTSKERNKGDRENLAKNILTKRAKWGQTKHAEHMKGKTSMLSHKRGCPRRINVGLDQVSTVPLDWSMDNTCYKAKFLKRT